MRSVLAQPRWIDLASAVLIGLNLAFFIEPAMERLRGLTYRRETREPVTTHPAGVFFTASLSLAFALASICLHDAMTSFVSGHGTTENSPVTAAILLIAAWAVVPFTVTLAWQCAGYRLLAILTGIIAGASPFLAGWLFSWSTQDVITTAVPCLLILALGYRRAYRSPEPGFLASRARIVALVATGWLLLALLAETGLLLFHLEQSRIYDASRTFIDARFYFGWAVGLVFAHFPPPRRSEISRERIASQAEGMRR
jgi:hypothetical protein